MGQGARSDVSIVLLGAIALLLALAGCLVTSLGGLTGGGAPGALFAVGVVYDRLNPTLQPAGPVHLSQYLGKSRPG